MSLPMTVAGVALAAEREFLRRTLGLAPRLVAQTADG
jgi:hypothetical protein